MEPGAVVLPRPRTPPPDAPGLPATFGLDVACAPSPDDAEEAGAVRAESVCPPPPPRAPPPFGGGVDALCAATPTAEPESDSFFDGVLTARPTDEDGDGAAAEALDDDEEGARAEAAVAAVAVGEEPSFSAASAHEISKFCGN